MNGSSERLERGGSLPDLALPSARGDGDLRLRPGRRRNPVVVQLHSTSCAGCRAYVAHLAARASELHEWDAAVVLILPAPSADLPFPAADDAERTFARRTGLAGACVVIADQWGEVAHVADAGAGHDLPSATEVVEWVRYLATRCPECEGEAL